MGPDHSQIEIYNESKHGVMFAAQRNLLKLDADPRTLTTRDMFVPTCATCHMSGINGLKVTHNPSDRLGWYLADAITTHRPNYLQAQINMKQVCTQCHTQALVDRVYDQGQQVVESTNAKVLAAKAIMDGLHKDGSLSGPPFTHTIDFTYFNLWHYDGRTSSTAPSWAEPTLCSGTATTNFSQRRSNFSMMPMSCGENMRINRLLSPIQKIVADPRLRWGHDPQLWVELFVAVNLAILAGGHFHRTLGQSFSESRRNTYRCISRSERRVVLACVIALRWMWGFEAPWRDVGYAVGWLSVLVGLGGVLYHLESRFFLDRTLKSLTYAAPFAAPLAYSGLGFLLLMNRMVAARSMEWARWVILLALGGFFGNFVLSLTDHASNGFFARTEWIPVISSAFATGFLIIPLILTVTRRFLDLCLVVMMGQAFVGVLGFWFHMRANLVEPGHNVFDKLGERRAAYGSVALSKPGRTGTYRFMGADPSCFGVRHRAVLARRNLRLGASGRRTRDRRVARTDT